MRNIKCFIIAGHVSQIGDKLVLNSHQYSKLSSNPSLTSKNNGDIDVGDEFVRQKVLGQNQNMLVTKYVCDKMCW